LAQSKWKERPLRLNFYGDGPCRKSLEAMARLLEVENVSFRGQVTDVRSIWAKNHALVLPSRYEGLPLVIVEAMFCGRMVITTDIAGNGEYLINGRTGFIAKAPTWRLLDEAMENAWSLRREWCEMGTAAREHLLSAIPANPIEEFSNRLMDCVTSAPVEAVV
jgi:glycosyltransferase involved in cell wall biosynthesis